MRTLLIFAGVLMSVSQAERARGQSFSMERQDAAKLTS
jgi:hypothetical protein